MAVRPGSLRALRETNRQRVIASLRRTSGLSQADLVRATGLSAATVSGLVRDLLEQGEVVSAERDSAGRRGRVLHLAHDRQRRGVGVDLGRTHARVLVGSGADRVDHESLVAMPLGYGPEEAVETVAALVRAGCADASVDLDDIRDVVVGLARPVDAHGVVAGDPRLSAWSGTPMADLLGTALGHPVVVENDANLGALAAASTTSHEQPVVFVKIAHGIGAGIAYRGEVIRGVGGLAGNIGHLTLDPRMASVCSCGRRGCLETIASAEAIRRSIEGVLDAELDRDDVLRMVADGHPVATEVLAEAAGFVGRALGWVATILNPSLVVIGGPLVVAGDALLGPVRQGFRQAVTDSVAASTTVELSTMGERAEALGALLLALPGDDPVRRD